MRATTAAAAPFITVWEGKQALAQDADLFRLDMLTQHLRLKYSVRLGELARQQQDFDLALLQQDDAGNALVERIKPAAKRTNRTLPLIRSRSLRMGTGC